MVFISKDSHTVIVRRMTQRATTCIITVRGNRKIRNIPTADFKRNYTFVDKPVAEVADIWLNSTIKLTDRVKRELEMAKKAKEVVEETATEAAEKVRNYSKKGEGKNAYIDPKSSFKALENKRHRGESLRVKVWQSLDKFESATAADIAADLGIEEKVAIGNLRSLVADGKAAVV